MAATTARKKTTRKPKTSTKAKTQAKATTKPPVATTLPSAFDLFKPSWEALKLNILPFVVLLVIPIIMYIVLFGFDFRGLAARPTPGAPFPVALMTEIGILVLIAFITAPMLLF